MIRGEAQKNVGSALEHLPPPKESELRTRILSRLEKVDVAALHALETAVAGFLPGVPIQNLRAKLVAAVTQAERSTGWGIAQDIVQIGYYRTAPDYFATLFHECGHSVLIQLGRTNEAYVQNQNAEEHFCWEFARTCCTLLGVAYSEVVEELGKAFLEVREKISDGTNAELFDAHVAKERALLGASEIGGDTCEWVDDRPVVAESRPIVLEEELEKAA